jgi:predicted dehydrogenase
MLKIGIIGDCDPVASLSRIISDLSSCSFSGSYHPDPEHANLLPDNDNMAVFSSYEAFLDGCDAIIVDHTDKINSNHIISAIKGSKHILLDKPLQWHDEELEYLFKLAEEAQILFKFRESFLFHPVLKAAAPYIQNPTFIDYQIGISSETLSENLPDLIIHSLIQCLDAIFYLNPARIKKTSTVFSPDLFGFPGVIHGRLEFDNGCISNITCNGYAEQHKSGCLIYQENRHANLNFLNQKLVIKDRLPGNDKLKSFTVPVKSKDPVAEEIWNFIDMILNKSFYLAPFHNYYQSFMLARKMIENLPIHTMAE